MANEEQLEAGQGREAGVFDSEEFHALLATYARATDDPQQTAVDLHQALEAVRAFCRARIAEVEEQRESAMRTSEYHIKQRQDALRLRDEAREARDEARRERDAALAQVDSIQAYVNQQSGQIETERAATAWHRLKLERLERGVVALVATIGGDGPPPQPHIEAYRWNGVGWDGQRG